MEFKDLPRYEIDCDALIYKEGDWVKYEDLLAVIKEKDQIIESLMQNSDSQTETNKAILNKYNDLLKVVESYIHNSKEIK